MAPAFLADLDAKLAELESAGLYKHERVIDSQQSAKIHVEDGGTVLNFCANNYLGLANHPDIMAAARAGIDAHGYGMASVRIIFGTPDVHRELGGRIAKFLSTQGAIRYGSRHPGALRRDGSRRHSHGHARQSARRGLGRLHGRATASRRMASQSFTAVSLLQHAHARDRARVDQGPRSPRARRRAAREAG